MCEINNNIYYRRILYFNAAQNLLTDNFLYFKGLIDINALNRLYESDLSKYPFKNKVILHDKQGCCSQYIMSKFTCYYSNKSDIYEILDDEFLCNKMQGIYIKNLSFLVFDTRYFDNSLFLYNLNGCYFGKELQRRNYSADDYILLSEYFFNYPL